METKHKWMLIIGVAVCLAIIYAYCEAEAATGYLSTYGNEVPIYVVLKEPILVEIEVEDCDHGACRKEKDTGMVYKIRAGTTEITNHGMVNIIPYHREARQLLGNRLRIPIVNIKCIITGENKVKGGIWEME